MSSLLLDANVAIFLHELNLWPGFISQNKIYVCSTVIHETLYYDDPATGNRIAINLALQVTNGSIIEVSASPQDQAVVLAELDKYPNAPLIHDGEIECLAILKKDVNGELIYCSCDGASIIALAMLSLAHKGISFESALKKSGMHRKDLKFRCTEEFFRKRITEGTLNSV